MRQQLLSDGALIASPDEEMKLRVRIDELEAQMQILRADYKAIARENDHLVQAMANLKRVLAPLHGALGQVFGELKGVPDDCEQFEFTAPDMSLQRKKVWEAWKEKLGGLPARFIEALLVHGPMTRTQLRIAVGCATGSVGDTIYKLNRAGLINKNGDKVSLKEMQ